MTGKKVIRIICYTLIATVVLTMLSFLSHPAIVSDVTLEHPVSLMELSELIVVNSTIDEDYQVKMTAGDPQLYLLGIKDVFHSLRFVFASPLDQMLVSQLYYAPEGGGISENNSISLIISSGATSVSYQLPENARYDQIRLDIDGDYQLLDIQYSQEPVNYHLRSYFDAVKSGITPIPWKQIFLIFVIALIETILCVHYHDQIKTWLRGCRDRFSIRKAMVTLFTWLFCIICSVACLWILWKTNVISEFNREAAVFFVLIGSMTGCLISTRRNFLSKPGKAFFIIGLHVGLAIVYLVPPLMYWSLDDETHFFRALDLSYGHTNLYTQAEAVEIYRTMLGWVSHNSAVSVERALTELHKMGSMVKYEGFVFGTMIPSYLPSAAGIWIGRVLGLSFPWILRLGRIGNLLCYLGVMGAAIHQMKRGKLMLSLVGMIPMVIFMAANYGYDTWCIAFITLGIVRLMNIWLDRKIVVDRKYMISILLPITLACMTKQWYMVLFALCFFIPGERFSSKKKRRIFIASIFLLILAIVVIYILPYKIYSVPVEDNRGGNVSAVEQAKYILSDPFKYLGMMVHYTYAAFLNPKDIMKWAITFFAYIDLRGYGFPGMFGVVYMVLVLLSAFVQEGSTDDASKGKRIRFRIISAVVMLLTCFGIETTMYLTFTPIGATTIAGCQSRYILPVLAAVPVIFLPKIDIFRKKKELICPGILIASAVILMSGLLPMVRGYIIG